MFLKRCLNPKKSIILILTTLCFIWSPADDTSGRVEEWEVKRTNVTKQKTSCRPRTFLPHLQIFYLQCWLFINENNNSHDATILLTFDLIDRVYSGVAMMHYCKLASPDVSVAMVPRQKACGTLFQEFNWKQIHKKHHRLWDEGCVEMLTDYKLHRSVTRRNYAYLNVYIPSCCYFSFIVMYNFKAADKIWFVSFLFCLCDLFLWS